MIGEVSRSKGLRQKAAAAPISTCLAPGFRFHPTDEELVSYYLKRKVTGQRIRVNAISEVDLYNTEPWDLPPHSRLRSRDLEWYFFTALDRKHSNRSRTNRATEEGYWKTTGKDRPVRRHSRTIGMKKTLVYHTGRAPRGQRTNWVMHEYRLEDAELSRAGISQDVYVLCRVFQKNGPGPQNGAQYGAPYEEEEWERNDEEDASHVSGNDPFIGSEGYLHLEDFFENQGTGNQHSDAVPLVAKSAEQDISSNTENLSSSKEKILKDEASVEDFTVSLPENTTILNGVRESPGVEDHSSTQNNCYVQLNDIFGNENTCFTSDGHSNDCLLGINYEISVVDGHSENFLTKHVNGKLLDTIGVRTHPDQGQICTVQHDMHVEPCDLRDDVPWLYDSTQLAEDNLMYYDALGDDIHHLENCFPDEASLVPMTGYGFLEELMAYYDATDDTLHYSATDSFVSKCLIVNPSPLVQSSLSGAEAAGNCTSSLGAVSVQENAEKSASLLKASNINSTLVGSSENLSAVNQQNDLAERLASILESISAPPAFAAEPAVFTKMAGHISAASTSSFHVTASMIQTQASSEMGCLESWALPKHCDSGVLFSYAMDDKIIRKSLRHEPLKGHCGVFSLFFRGGFHSFFLSVLMLALSYRLGVYVYNL